MKRLIAIVAVTVLAATLVWVGADYIRDESKVSHSVATEPAKSESLRTVVGGEENLRVADTINRAVAMYGSDSLEVSSLVQIAATACGEHATQTSGKAASDWAQSYLDYACDGFSADRYAFGQEGVDLNSSEESLGREAAISQALAELRNPQTMSSQIMAGWFLIERHALPNQDQYGLGDEGLARAFSAASGLALCGRLNACGARSLLTAQVCTAKKCPPDTTFGDALRLHLSGAEYAAAQRMVAFLQSQ